MGQGSVATTTLPGAETKDCRGVRSSFRTSLGTQGPRTRSGDSSEEGLVASTLPNSYSYTHVRTIVVSVDNIGTPLISLKKVFILIPLTVVSECTTYLFLFDLVT